MRQRSDYPALVHDCRALWPETGARLLWPTVSLSPKTLSLKQPLSRTSCTDAEASVPSAPSRPQSRRARADGLSRVSFPHKAARPTEIQLRRTAVGECSTADGCASGIHHGLRRDAEVFVHLGDLSGHAERARVDKPAFGRYGGLSPFAPAPPLPCRAPCRGSDRDRPRPASRTAVSTASTRICHGFGAGGRLTGGVPSGSGMSSGPGLGGGDGGRGGILGSGI